MLLGHADISTRRSITHVARERLNALHAQHHPGLNPLKWVRSCGRFSLGRKGAKETQNQRQPGFSLRLCASCAFASKKPPRRAPSLRYLRRTGDRVRGPLARARTPVCHPATLSHQGVSPPTSADQSGTRANSATRSATRPSAKAERAVNELPCTPRLPTIDPRPARSARSPRPRHVVRG